MLTYRLLDPGNMREIVGDASFVVAGDEDEGDALVGQHAGKVEARPFPQVDIDHGAVGRAGIQDVALFECAPKRADDGRPGAFQQSLLVGGR
jgi:hypothetical protein